MSRNICKLLVLLSVCLFQSIQSGNAQQSDFFWSTQDLGQGAVNGPLFLNAEQGEVISLYLYYSSNGISDQDLDGGALLDLATSRIQAIRFTAAETFNPTIFIQDFQVENRWFDPMKSGNATGAAGNLGFVTDEEINEWGAFGVVSAGMNDQTTGPTFFDSGYDIDADAFLFGRVDVEVLGNANGCVQIRAGRGQGGIVIGDGLDAEFFEPVFGSCAITIGDFILGDVNFDGTADLLDVVPFINQLTNGSFLAEADINCDDLLDLRDVQPFVRLLNGEGFEVQDPTTENDTPKAGQLGDANGDGFVDVLDGECYALIETDCGFGVPGADINMDGVLNLLDIYAYVELLQTLE